MCGVSKDGIAEDGSAKIIKIMVERKGSYLMSLSSLLYSYYFYLFPIVNLGRLGLGLASQPLHDDFLMSP